jgi:cell division septum initiation protein DivIVA
MNELVEKRIHKLQQNVKHKQLSIEAHQKQIIEIQNEIQQLENSECKHSTVKKIHSSSGSYFVQTICCDDCKKIIDQNESGTYLFHPSKADKVFCRGN